jgi:hypothetical protein
VFDGWVIESGTGSFANAANASTTFTMGSADATITATYKDIPLLPTTVSIPMRLAGNVRISGPIRSDETVHIFSGVDAGRVDIDNTNANAILKTDTIIFYSDDTSDGLLRNLNTTGVQGIATSAQPARVVVRKIFSAATHTYFSLPFDVAPSSILNGNTAQALDFDTEYGVWGFDAEIRSSLEGFSKSSVWKEIIYASESIKKGMGYQFWYGPVGVVDFVTTDATTINNLFALKNKDITFTKYRTNAGFLEQEELDAGWAFIGSLHSAAFRFLQANVGGYHPLGAIYYRNTKDSRSTGTQKAGSYNEFILGLDDSTSKIAKMGPFTPFYIQGNIPEGTSTLDGTFTYNSSGLLLEDITFRSSNDDVLQDLLYFVLSSDKNNSYDRFYLNFSDKYAESFRAIEDAVKMSTEYDDRPAVWSLLNATNTKLVLNGLPLKDDKAIRMGYSVPEPGSYTISLNPLHQQNIRNVVLVDNVTGNKVDLLKTPYSFNTGAVTENNARFVLHINSSYTGTPVIDSDGVYAFVKDNLLTVNNLLEGERIQVLDLAGRIIVSGTATGKIFSVPLNQKGVYIVNIKGEKTTVLKVLNK